MMYINFYDKVDIAEHAHVDEDLGLVCDSKGIDKLRDKIKSMKAENWEFVECKQESKDSSIFLLQFRKVWR